LIPGGILAMTGVGMYIGQPRNALNFITTQAQSVCLLLGIYLLIWRSSLQK